MESDGSLDVHLLEKSIRPDTAIVSIMWANNETGVLFPIEEIAAICRSKGVLCHTDAVQVPGKLKIDVKALGVDFLSLSAHKLHAPKGIGLLYVKRRTKYQPYVIGGHQERGRRGGTENVAHIVGFGRAAELAMANLHDENTRVRALRDKLENTILTTIPNTVRNGAKRRPPAQHRKHRLRLRGSGSRAPAARPAWDLLQQRQRLHHRFARPLACAHGHGPEPDARARQRALQPGDV